MARSFGRVLASIWDDPDFQAVGATAQRMYVFLISQADLEHSGIIPLRERRWAKSCGELTVEQVRQDVKELAAAGFVIIDEDTEELLVRSLIRRDDIWKQPNVFKSAATSATGSQSPAIKAALYAEVARLDLSGAAHDSRTVRQDLMAHLAPFADPSGTPSEPFANPSLGVPVPTVGKGSSNGSTEEVPLSPYPDPLTPPATQPVAALREDVERLCQHLADRIEANGSKRPTVTERWRDAARLLMDRDGKTEEQVRRAIDWCQDDEWWRANVMSMPKLREQYDRLRLQASRTATGTRSTTDNRVAAAQALKQRLGQPDQSPPAIEGGAS